MNDQYKLAVVGYENSISLYRAIGAESFPVTDKDSAQAQTEELFMAHQGDENKTPKYATIFIEENFYAELPDDLIEKFSKKALPAVVPVPSPSSQGESFAAKRMGKIIERAIGSDILG